MDGPFYVDTRAPHIQVTYPTITLTTTYKALAPREAYPKLGANYFGWVGKAVRLTCYGVSFTGATPGNIAFSILWGTNADNNGTVIGGVNMTGTANLPNVIFKSEFIIRCRAIGSSGAFQIQGYFMQQQSGYLMIPPSGGNPVQTGIDLTQDYVLSFQASRSGSTAETILITDMLFEALN